MKYISTRGQAPALGFTDVLLAGLAPDGGLYVPETWPQLTHDELLALRGSSYAEIAFAVIKPFAGGEIEDAQLRAMIDEAYATFAHKAVVPLKQLDANHWLMELFHGPTLAFKDVAMQLLARLMDHALQRRRQARHHRGCHIRRYRWCRHRCICSLNAHRHLHPASARSRQRCAAPPDDHHGQAEHSQHRA